MGDGVFKMAPQQCHSFPLSTSFLKLCSLTRHWLIAMDTRKFLILAPVAKIFASQIWFLTGVVLKMLNAYNRLKKSHLGFAAQR